MDTKQDSQNSKDQTTFNKGISCAFCKKIGHLIGDCRKLQAKTEQEQNDKVSASGSFSKVRLSNSHVPNHIAGKLFPSFHTDKGILPHGSTSSQIIYASESVTRTPSSVGKGFCLKFLWIKLLFLIMPRSPSHFSYTVGQGEVRSKQGSVKTIIDFWG